MPVNPLREAIFDKKFLGGYSEGGTPVPIPNTEAKSFCADGTALFRGGRVGHRRDFYFYPAYSSPIRLRSKITIPAIALVRLSPQMEDCEWE